MKRIYRQNEIHDLANYLKNEVFENTVLCSGYFAVTYHSGHLSFLHAASELGHLVLCINGTISTINKYGIEPVSIKDRLNLAAELRCVSEVLEYDADDMSEVIKILRPTYFCNGGDVSVEAKTFNQKEINAALSVGCSIRDNIGGGKINSNSNIIQTIRRSMYHELESCWRSFQY